MTDLRRVDINLIVILDAILSEQHLTRAGEQLGMSQPAVSGALARLRRIYNDPLLIRSGGSLELTPVAEAIKPLVREARLQVQRTLDLSPTFDPQTSARRFLISASDYVLSCLTSPLLAAFERDAPGATVEFDGLPDGGEITPIDLLRRDVIIAGVGRGVPGKQQQLFTDHFVCIADAAHPRLDSGSLTLRDLGELGHVRSEFGGRVLTHVDDMLRAAGVRPKSVISVRGFLAVPVMVQGTDLVGFVPERLARRYAPALGLTIAETPCVGAPLVEAAHWHPSKSRDPALVWLINTLRVAAKTFAFQRV